ncbi:MAG TPA: aminopeptidase P family N-terminal domain-containing protein, partial [Burkholderiaceae bacterium]|nr:aminopeptidase P family N-terminal domain-containing protein [Burkholderiaceae bacterium]
MDSRISVQRERIERVREVLARNAAHALLVPSADPHLSEYLPARWQGRQWLSGFTGSMGTLVVTLDRAALFADSRYWGQAERELAGSGIDLEKIPSGSSMLHIDWIARQLTAGQTLMVDGEVLGLAAAHALRAALDKAGIVVRTDTDLLAQAWEQRPALPVRAVYEHLPPQAVQTRAQRLACVREAMARHGATHHFVSSVDDVAWITNLRGGDVEYNPVFLAHLLVERDRATLYVGAGKIDAALAARLQHDGLLLADYAAAADALRALPSGATLLVDPRRITLGFRQRVSAGVRVVEAINPSTLA